MRYYHNFLLARTVSFLLLRTVSKCIAFTPAQSYSNILILDHLNINHEKGRHDLVKAFYFDFLQCGIDPRKADNLIQGKKTLWANIGAQQLHLPEGNPDAQILNGKISLGFGNIMELIENYENNDDLQLQLKGSEFQMDQVSDSEINVKDPWGNEFTIISTNEKKDERGVQHGNSSLGINMKDITFYVPTDTNFAGIGRFYRKVFDTPIVTQDDDTCIVSMGPYQTLTFQGHPQGYADSTSFVDLREEPEKNPRNKPFYVSNYGPHISMYIKDIRSTYNRAKDLGVTYINPRFSRKAYTEKEVINDCMFRCLHIIDPENVNDGIILSLEHEVRSVVKSNGDLYKSCPFDTVQDGCVV
mmetsp:Transcript_15786/g.19250  ORF Transcript_15786/g.19250 Transcript_15786/m.19250 type:complete len:357 (-) Transcript_15786:16-1086(-)